MLLLRVLLPNRPGALGAVASALGTIDADINLVEIVDKHGDVEVDDFILDLAPDQTVSSLVAACEGVPGVQVQWVRNYPRGGGIDLDVDLDRRMAADGSRAGLTLATAAPLVFRAQWSLLLQVSPAPEATFRSPGCPDLDSDDLQRFAPFATLHRVPLEAGWRPGWEPHHAVVAPLPERQAVVIGRRGEPPFFPSELARLAHLVGWVDPEGAAAQAAPRTRPNTAHRTPIAAPLYSREDPPSSGSTPGAS